MLGGFAVDFYPRSPCGERPHPVTVLVCIIEFLSTLSLRRATAGVNSMLTLIQISIHALLAESDYIRSNVPNFSSISIHALLAESDGAATLAKYQYLHFYPRSPCGERLLLTVVPYGQYKISIHALLAESDISQLQCILGGKYFYPRSPCGERLQSECPFAEAVPDFYPRSPCGERLVNLGNIATTRTLFLSTLSLRRATARPRYYSMGRYISIHALLAESDHSFSHAIIILVLFLSTLSLRRATI